MVTCILSPLPISRKLLPRFILYINRDSKVHGANMGPTWVLLSPGGPNVSPMNLAIWDLLHLSPNWKLNPSTAALSPLVSDNSAPHPEDAGLIDADAASLNWSTYIVRTDAAASVSVFQSWLYVCPSPFRH